MEQQNLEPQSQNNSKTLLIIIVVLIILLIAITAFSFWQISNLGLQAEEERTELMRLREEMEELKKVEEEVIDDVEGIGAYESAEYTPYSIKDENLTLPDLDNFNTYENNDYSYSFKYDSEVLTCERDPYITEAINPKQPADFDEEKRAVNRILCTGECEIRPGYLDCSPPQMEITVHKNLTGASVNDFCNKMLAPQRLEDDYNICSSVNYSIANLSAIRDTLKYTSSDIVMIDGVSHEREAFIQDRIYFTQGDKNYIISNITGLNSIEDRASIEATLSTFKFTE